MSQPTENETTMAWLRERHARLTAGEAEFQSWIYRLSAHAITYCPGTDRMHHDVKADPSSGYSWRCVHCGHHNDFPF